MEERREVLHSSGVVSLAKPYVVNLNVKEKIFINAVIILTSGTTIEAMASTVQSVNGYENAETLDGKCLSL